jgi:hypothetical protein
MSLLSVRFAQALAHGRQCPAPAETRESLLYTLLRKRAAAANAGAYELEALLRAQILWSLPTHYGDQEMIVLLEAA